MHKRIHRTSTHLDEMRYGHRLYLDKETALPLRRVVLNRQGKPISQLMFTTIDIKGIGDRENHTEFEPPPESVDYQGRWSFDGLPEAQEWGGALAFFYDPDGNVLTLVEYPKGALLNLRQGHIRKVHTRSSHL